MHFIFFHFYIIKVDIEDLTSNVFIVIKESIMNKCPQKFYGVKLNSIRTEADALKALDSFIRNADGDEFTTAVRELDTMNDAVRSIINRLLWKLEYDLSSPEFIRCFNLKYASA